MFQNAENNYELKYQKLKTVFKNMNKEKNILERQNTTLLMHLQDLKTKVCKSQTSQRFLKSLNYMEVRRSSRGYLRSCSICRSSSSSRRSF